MIRSTLITVGLFAHLSAAETLLVPEQYPTIQAAVDIASDGDTIEIGPGTYSGFEIPGYPRDLTIQGREGQDQTIIEGNGSNERAIFLDFRASDFPPPNISIQGLTIQNFNATTGSAIFALDGNWSKLHIKDTIIESCAERCIDLQFTTAAGFDWHLNNILFRNCSASQGGMLLWNPNFGALTNSKFESCSAMITNQPIDLVGVHFQSCTSGSYPCLLPAVALVSDCRFENNLFTQSILMMNPGGSTIQNCIFESNGLATVEYPEASPILANGGGIIYGCTFTGNQGSTGGAIHSMQQDGSLIIEDCVFNMNNALLQGGAIYGDPGGESAFVFGSTFCDNSPEPVSGDVVVSTDTNLDACPDDTPVPCCLGTACIELLESVCTSNGGEILDAPCSESNCSSEGACCISGTCTVTTVETCFSLGGSFAGNNTDCTTTDCPSSCEGDVSGNGTVDFTDLLILINNWGPCSG